MFAFDSDSAVTIHAQIERGGNGLRGVRFRRGEIGAVGITTEEAMLKTILSSLSVAALAGASMLALQSSPASALTLYGPSAPPLASGQFEQVYYRATGVHGAYHREYHGGYYHGGYHGGYAYHGGYGYHGYGYGYHPGYGWGAAAVGAAAVGAAAGAAAAAPHCWINANGNQVCN
jgi:hypothetical protein